MRVSCQVCSAEYEVDESRIPQEGLPVKCTSCLSVFTIEAPLPPAPATDSRHLPAPAVQPPAPRSSGASAWESQSTNAPAPWDPPAPVAPEPPAPASWEAEAREPPAPWDAPAASQPAPPAVPSTPAGVPPPDVNAWNPPGTPSAWESTPQQSSGIELDLPQVSTTGVDPPASPGWERNAWESAPASSAPTTWEEPVASGGADRPVDFNALFEGVNAAGGATHKVDQVAYVIQRHGAEFGPFDQMSLRAHIQTGRFKGPEQASSDGGHTWRSLSQFAEFSDLFQSQERIAELARVDFRPATRQSGEVVGGVKREIASGGASGSLQSSGAASPSVSSSSLGSAPGGLGQAHGTMGAPRETFGAGPASSFPDPSSFSAPPTQPENRWTPDEPPGDDFLSEFDSLASEPTTTAPPPPGAELPPKSSIPRPAQRPTWMAPAVTSEGGRAYADAARSQRRKRMLAIGLVGMLICGGAAFFFLWEPGFDGDGAIRRRITLTDAQLKRYRAQARTLLQKGTYRGYAKARTRLASVVRSDPKDRMAKSLYLQSLLYLVREHGQVRVAREVGRYRRELDRAGERGIEFQKAKAAYSLWKKDRAAALRYVERVLAARPRDREARYLQGLALTSPKTLDKAIKVFDELLKEDPKSAKFLRAKAEAQLLTDRAAARGTLRKIVETSPSNAGASLRLAQIYMDDGKTKDAKRLFAWVIDPRAPARREAAPDELAKAFSFLGRIALSAEDLGAARKYLTDALKVATSANEQVRARLALADVLRQQREYKAAVKPLEFARRRKPGSPEVLWRLAICYVRSGQTGKARATVIEGMKIIRSRRVEELSPTQKTQHLLEAARMRIASAVVNEFGSVRRLSEGADELKEAFKLARTAGGTAGAEVMLDARVRLAGLLRSQKNLKGARAALDAAKKIDANSAEVHNGFGELYEEQGEKKQAEVAFRKAIRLRPRFAKARFNLATLLSEQGRVAPALKQLEALRKSDPKFPGLHLAMAMAFQRQRRFSDAIEAFQRAVKMSPNDPRVFLRIGMAYFELGGEQNLRKARRYLDKAIDKDRKLVEAYYYRGRVLMLLGKPEIALDDFKIASDREQDNGVYRVFWGWAFERTGSFRDAMFQYNRAIELLRRQQNEVDIALAYYRRGRLRLERDEIRAALRDLDKALKYNSANTDVLVLLGDSLVQARRYKEAVGRYEKALARGSKSKGLSFKLGKALLQINARREAGAALRRAAAEDPGDCYPHYYLGYLAKDAKNERQAIRSMKKFLKLCPKAPEQKDVNRDIYDMERRLGLVKGP